MKKICTLFFYALCCYLPQSLAISKLNCDLDYYSQYEELDVNRNEATDQISISYNIKDTYWINKVYSLNSEIHQALLLNTNQLENTKDISSRIYKNFTSRLENDFFYELSDTKISEISSNDFIFTFSLRPSPEIAISRIKERFGILIKEIKGKFYIFETHTFSDSYPPSFKEIKENLALLNNNCLNIKNTNIKVSLLRK